MKGYYCRYIDCMKRAEYMVYQIIDDVKYSVYCCKKHQGWASGRLQILEKKILKTHKEKNEKE